jgi:CHAT domain-containing protein
LWLLLFLLPGAASGQAGGPIQQGIAAADQLFQANQSLAAVEEWQALLAGGHASESQAVQLRIRLMAGYQALGEQKRAIGHAEKALESLDHLELPLPQHALLLQQVADLLQTFGALEQALTSIDEAVAMARESDEPELLVASLNTQANVLAAMALYPEALEIYDEAIRLAQQGRLRELQARARLNRIHTLIAAQQLGQVASEIASARKELENLPAGQARRSLHLTLGILARRGGPDQRMLAHRLLNQASTAALEAGALGDAGMAMANLALLYESAGQREDALKLIRRAIFLSEQLGNPETGYRWLRIEGRLLADSGKLGDALRVYRRTVEVLSPVRDKVDLGYRSPVGSFEETVKAVYFELADLLLRKAEQTVDADQKGSLLREARDTVEQLRMAELANFFQDDCVAEARKREKSLDTLAAGTAILYPVILPDRLALIVSDQQEIFQVSVSVSRETLAEVTLAFRKNLQTRPHNRFLVQATQLYDWLLRPVEEFLARRKVETIVVIPDGPLRTIPFATLHDGQRFAIERFAMVTSPGLTLTDPTPLHEAQMQVLLAGVSDSVQDFSPLPGVPEELRKIAEITSGTRILNRDYSLAAFREQLKETPFAIIHMATHGQFTGDPESSFLLTYDEKLTMERLEEVIGYGKFRKQPLELLTLSACQTALGDERAALGLAGIAVKAGARSAIATLWFVDDEATARAMTEFYQELFGPNPISKAKALQQVQLGLLSQSRFAHPAYWGPFLLIGNWL